MNNEIIQELLNNLYDFIKEKLSFSEDISQLHLLPDEENSRLILGKTGYYSPETKEITLFTKDRHPKDILRSFAHELIHHSQNLNNKINNISNLNFGYAQTNADLRNLEKEAYLQGNILFRDWEDQLKTDPTQQGILYEGGNAAKALIKKKLSTQPDNQNRNLHYGKITDSDLKYMFPENPYTIPSDSDETYIGNLLNFLYKNDCIESKYIPRYFLGSTRLAALKHYGKDFVDLDRYEIDDVISTASEKKSEYGDLDVDVVFKKGIKEIVSAINSEMDNETYAAQGFGGNEMSVAVRIGEKVVQVDFFDVGSDPIAAKVLQYSSFVDLSDSVKGVYQVILLRALASATNLSEQEQLDAILKMIQANPESELAVQFKKQSKLGFEPVGTRYSLAGDGLRLVLMLQRLNDNKRTVTKKLQTQLDPKYDFKDLKMFAKALLGDTSAPPDILLSAVKLAEYIKKNYSVEQRQKIWDEFIRSTESALRGRVMEPENRKGFEYLENIIKPKKTLKEGKEAIGRVSGNNEFSNKNLLEMLKALVDSTRAQGKPRVRLDLSKQPLVDMVEKVDSNFINFGINDSGQFFMQSSNSGQVTKDNAKAKFGFSEDLLKSFYSALRNKKFQSSLKKIYRMVGAFMYDAELFPMMTHVGNEDGSVIFVATPYSKSEFGKSGAFVVFKSRLYDDGWYRPSPEKNKELINIIKNLSTLDGWESDWKIYTNEQDMQRNVIFDINFGEVLASYLRDDDSFASGLKILRSRSKSFEKENLVNALKHFRATIQNKLDNYANKAKSVLSDDKDSYIEGVIFRIKSVDGDIYEVKGTSPSFLRKRMRFGRTVQTF